MHGNKLCQTSDTAFASASGAGGAGVSANYIADQNAGRAPQERIAVTRALDSMNASWCEDFAGKMSLWGHLPNAILGVFPLDDLLQSMAQQCSEL